jgi:hypothetical protein
MHAAVQLARELDEAVIVVVFPDFGDRYLSTSLWGGWRDWIARTQAVEKGPADAERRAD